MRCRWPNYKYDSPQYMWLQADLKAVNRTLTPWVSRPALQCRSFLHAQGCGVCRFLHAQGCGVCRCS